MVTMARITQLMTTDSGICSGPTLTYSTVSSSINALVRLFNCFSSFLKNRVPGVRPPHRPGGAASFLSLEEKAQLCEKSKEGVRLYPVTPSLLHGSLRLFSLCMIVRLTKIGK